MIFLILVIQIILVFCQDNNIAEYDSVVIGNLRKRDQIPLYRLNRRLEGNNLNYRRTRDIREEFDTDRKYELPTSIENLQLLKRREQIPINLLNEFWDDNDFTDNYRRTQQESGRRMRVDNYSRNENEKYLQMSESRKEEIFKEEAQEDLEKLQRELRWFTIPDDNNRS